MDVITCLFAVCKHVCVLFQTHTHALVCLTESSSEFVEQLGPVGLPHELSIQSLFDPTGRAAHPPQDTHTQPPTLTQPLRVCLSLCVCLCVCARTGQCCAHQQCAAWSEGVCCGEGQSLLYVDKAIDWGSTQVCFSALVLQTHSLS